VNPERPVAVRAGLDRCRWRTLSGPVRPARDQDDDLRDAVWLYEWSHAGLAPIGEAEAASVAIAG
jgi:hypothetical protein